MLNDKDVLPVVYHWASVLKNKQVSFEELVSIGYIYGKPLRDVRLLNKWIKWKMIKFLMDTKNSSSPIIDNLEAPAETPSLDDEMDLRNILSCVKLSEQEEELLHNRFWDDMTYSEIGKKHNLTTSYTRRKIMSILKKLRGKLNEQ